MHQALPVCRGAAVLATLVALAATTGPTVAREAEISWSRLTGAAPTPADIRLEAVLLLVGGGGLTLAWSWLVVCVLVALRDACADCTAPRASGPLRPALLRAVLGLACAGAVGAAATPAHASPVPPDPDVRLAGPGPQSRPHSGPQTGPHAGPHSVRGTLPEALRGLPLPDRVTDVGPPLRSRVHREVRVEPRDPRSAREPLVRRVRPGDTLWSLTEELLRARNGSRATTPQAVDRGWRLLHRANRAALGPDPDLIHSGTVLTIPQRLAPTVPTSTLGEQR